uniref:Uncharacterized protein n=1 Tax=Anguilla anguilla TaxID=7936 RepID=A0A0E9RCB5_ANGAN
MMSYRQSLSGLSSGELSWKRSRRSCSEGRHIVRRELKRDFLDSL